jgi:D-alanyl-D-alanine-carboxypeptidase/D-alanyl-D-alanine-endopeptidase
LCRIILSSYGSSIVGFVALLVAATSVLAQNPSLSSSGPAAGEIFAQTHSTAMALVVVRDHEVYLQGFGETAPGSGKAPGPDSILRLCSVTKIFATDLLTKLMQERVVRLDDPLQRFAPPNVKIPTLTLHSAAQHSITLADLATHTAGLPREIGTAPAGTPHFTFPNFAERWAWLPKQKLRSSPGTAALYSNVGFDLLGDALANAAQKPYPQLLAERTTRPLGLKDTTFTPTPDQCNRLLRGYHPRRAHEPPVCTATFQSAGSAGLYSTPTDMAKWLEYLLGTTENPTLRQNPAAQAAYLQPADLTSVKGLDHAGDPSGIGLGWIRVGDPSSAGLIVQKTGGGAGFTSYLAMLPAKHMGVFIAMTEGGPWGDARHPYHPFYATNNLLLSLAGLPPMQLPPDPPAPKPRNTQNKRRHR